MYGFNKAEDRMHLWQALGRTSVSCNGAWVICGYFNNVHNLNDKIGSQVTLDEVEDFRNCVRR